MQEALKKIRAAEQRAQEQIEKARADAEALLAGAQEEARQVLADATARSHAMAAEKLQSACARARIEADAIARAGDGRAAALKAQARQLVEDAARLIVRRIVGEA